MSEPVQRLPEDIPPGAVNTVIEAFLVYLGPKEARLFLRVLAARLAESGPSNIINMRDRRSGDGDGRMDRVWLRERLTDWLARYG